MEIPGTTAPFGSFTRPTIFPVAACDCAKTVGTKTIRRITSTENLIRVKDLVGIQASFIEPTHYERRTTWVHRCKTKGIVSPRKRVLTNPCVWNGAILVERPPQIKEILGTNGGCLKNGNNRK
jgi:hypothetical protein